MYLTVACVIPYMCTSRLGEFNLIFFFKKEICVGILGNVACQEEVCENNFSNTGTMYDTMTPIHHV